MVDTPYQSPQETPQAERRSPWHSLPFLAVLPLLLLVVYCCIPFVAIPLDVYNSHRERQRLLHETDHHALLTASRKLMKEHAGEEIAEPAHDPRVPRIIRELGPSYMSISTERLRVELHGGFDHYGFVALPDGANGGDGWGKLIDGLYYYTE